MLQFLQVLIHDEEACMMQPNVLFIMTDQHRFDYLSCAGADFIRTPNLDRLAKSGVRMTHCFTNAPICVPARIGLALGLQPVRVGALNNDAYLPLHAPTMYQQIRDHGYRVGNVGKLDLAKPDANNGKHGDRPCVYSWGFTHPEEIEGKMHAGQNNKPLGPYGHHLESKGLYQAFREDYKRRQQNGWIAGMSHDSVLPTDDFADAYIGQRAARWVSSVSDDFPWALFVNFVGPHDPYDPPTEYASRYRDVEMPAPVEDSMIHKPEWVQKKRLAMDRAEVTHIQRQYCAAIELIDDQIGMILKELDQRGMTDNTIIIFTSDHGEMMGDHGLFQKAVAYEPSIRVPLIVSGPGLPRGKHSDALIELIDLNPTLCNLAGIGEHPNMDARSFEKVLRGEADSHRPNIVSRLEQFQCIRTERHKLILNMSGPNELYDLQADPHELNNRINEELDMARSMRETLKKRYQEGKWNR
jgi:arylsulfatase